MSDTRKDLKSHRKPFGEFKINNVQRKLTPFKLFADKEEGNRSSLVFIDNDMSQDDFNKGLHWNNAKRVRSLRKQKRQERQDEKGSARNKLKRNLQQKVQDGK